MTSSYRFMYIEDKPTFSKVLSNLKPQVFTTDNRNMSIEKYETIPNTKSANYVSKHYDNVTWYRLTAHREFIYRRQRTYIAEILMDNSKIIVMRNGSNINEHNFLIYDVRNEKFYFRRNFLDAYTLVNILTMSLENIPLLIGQNLCKKNIEMMNARLKNET